MALQSWWKSAVGGVALAVALSASAAMACSRVASTNISGFRVLPVDGSRVPRSTAVWVRSDLVLASGEAFKDVSSVKVLDERGKSLALSVTQVRVSGEQPSTLFVLKPMSNLEANASYRVEVAGEVLSRFSTSDDVDTVPPPVPLARLSEVKGETFGAWSCGQPSSVSVQLEGAGDVNFLVAGSSSGASMPGAALAVSTSSTVVAVSVPEGAVELRVVAFDLSGNLSSSAEKLTPVVPFQTQGCSATPVGLGVGLLALAGLLRRRSHRVQVGRVVGG